MPANGMLDRVHEFQGSACCLCGSEAVRHFRRARDRQNGNDGIFTYVRCLECGLVRLHPVPSAAELAKAYPSDYYSYQEPAMPTAAPVRRTRLVHVCDPDPDVDWGPSGYVLDVGCGSGAFLVVMRRRGWQVQGVELSAAAAARGNQVLGPCIVTGTLEEARFPSAGFDLVRMNHSLEHMPDPDAAVREAKRILKPGGRLFVGVPNVTSALGVLFGKYWWGLSPGVHTYHFSPATLRRLAAKHGFEVESLRLRSEYAALTGSLRVLCNRVRHGPPPAGTAPPWSKATLQHLAQTIVSGLDRLGWGDSMELLARKPSAAGA